MIPCATINQQHSLLGGTRHDRDAMYAESVKDPNRFWSRLAKQNFYWKSTWPSDDAACRYNFSRQKGPIFTKWFEGGKTNVCYNAIDRYLPQHKDRVCYFFEGNDPTRREVITYGQMHQQVLEMANVLQTVYGIQKGDVVAMYLPMIPFTVVCMMACARIGAVPMVVFAGFSFEALATRLEDGRPKLLLTADASVRGKKLIPLKRIVDKALAKPEIQALHLSCLVITNAGRQHCQMTPERDAWYEDVRSRLTPAQRKHDPLIWLDAEDILFILYTSGSTGKPKAVVHTTGGYMVYAATTFRYVFDYHPEDVYFCTGDVGWITGHSYAVYGPMLNGATSVLFEGIFNFPTLSRWWELVERYKVTLFYTAPTAIRALMKFGEEPVKKHDLSSLRVLGSVGEPINVEAWRWFYNVVGGGHVDVVDTYWQTESGGHMLTTLPGCTAMKPSCTGLPFFGVEPALLDPKTSAVVEGAADGLLAMRHPWPGICRTLLNDHSKFEQLYFSVEGYYISGDGARRDADGYYWITGRIDDVLNVSGHRLGTSEIEDAISRHSAVVECAVVGVPHDVKGESIYAYVALHQNVQITAALLEEIQAQVRTAIGPIAVPDVLHPAPRGLPKTRSGKIVRRLLRKLAMRKDKEFGDLSTLADPEVVPALITARKAWVEKRPAHKL